MKWWKATSIGFKLLVLTWIGVLLFFGWARRTPPLETVWKLEQQLKNGTIASLTDRQEHLFYDIMKRYPPYETSLGGRRGIDILSANIDGRSLTDRIVLLRTDVAEHCGDVTLDVSGDDAVFPVTFHIEGRTWQRSRTLKESGSLTIHLPRGVLLPEFIDIQQERRHEKGEVDIKVRFCR